MDIDIKDIYNLLDLPDPDLLERVTARVDWAIKKLSAAEVIIPAPEISFKLSGTTAGYAYRHKNLIKLNLALLNNQPDEFIERTIPHEIAHLAAFKYWPNHTPHGDAWAILMERVLGLPASRCHSYDVSDKYVTYDCTCAMGCKLGPTQHKKLQAGRANYRCRICKQWLLEVRREQ